MMLFMIVTIIKRRRRSLLSKKQIRKESLIRYHMLSNQKHRNIYFHHKNFST